MNAARARLLGFVVAVTLGLFTPSPAMAEYGRLPVDTVISPVLSSRHASVVPHSARTRTLDAFSVNTRNWSCIRLYESRNGQASSNVYQFEGATFHAMTGLTGYPGQYPRSTQNAAALRLYAYDLRVFGNGFAAWSTRFVCGLSGDR